VILLPDHFRQVPVYDLLVEAARGRIGIDQRFLRAIVERMDEAADALVRFGLEGREEDTVPLESDLIAIFRSRPRREAIPFLIDCVRRQPHDVDDDLLDAFLRQGDAAVEPLLDLYEEVGSANGGEIAFVLAALQVRDDRIPRLLIERLRLDTGDAGFCLGIYADASARPALEAALEASLPSDPHYDWTVRSLREAINRLEHPEPPSKMEAYDMWAEYPEEAAPQFEFLSEDERAEYLSSPLAEHRVHAAASFRNAKPAQGAAALLLRLAQDDPEPEVRAACWESLANESDEERVREAMLRCLNTAESPLVERCGALVGLASEADDPSVRRYILEFYQLPEARAKALEAMWNSMDRGFAEQVSESLDDPVPEVRRQAVLSVGYLRLSAHVGRLAGMFASEELRMEALHSYALAAPGGTSRLRMRQLFNKIDELADGLSEDEACLIQEALNARLDMHGLEPLSFTESHREEEPSPPPGRNDPCPCGSGKKYKKCCGAEA